VLINGTEEHARQIKEEATEVLEKRLKMELSTEKTLITHIDEGYEFLGFKIFRTTRSSGRKKVVFTIPSKASLASVMSKVKKVACRNTHMTLAQIIKVVNQILRGWVSYFRHAASKRTFSYLNCYSWWRLIHWLRKKHKGMTWKELRRRYYGKDRIRDGDLVLYNPATQPVTRYRYRGTKIAVSWDRFRLRDKILTTATSHV
jgi:RNA-directed DNA polymerase